MASIGHWTKVWVFASLCALLFWVVVLLPGSFVHFFNFILGKPDLYAGNPGILMASHIGLIARFFAVILALSAGFMLWSIKNPSLKKFERIIETALFLEGTYYILLFPSGLWWVGLGFNFLGVDYLLRAALVGTVLLVLSFKVREHSKGVNVLNWIGIAIVAYIVALWSNVVLGWFDMIALIGSGFLFHGANSLGFLISLITMSLAVVFAVSGAYLLVKNQGDAIKWFGFSLVMIGLNCIVYLTYSFLSGNLNPAMAIDVWALPFFGLGISLMRTKTAKNIIESDTLEKAVQLTIPSSKDA